MSYSTNDYYWVTSLVFCNIEWIKWDVIYGNCLCKDCEKCFIISGWHELLLCFGQKCLKLIQFCKIKEEVVRVVSLILSVIILCHVYGGSMHSVLDVYVICMTFQCWISSGFLIIHHSFCETEWYWMCDILYSEVHLSGQVVSMLDLYS